MSVQKWGKPKHRKHLEKFIWTHSAFSNCDAAMQEKWCTRCAEPNQFATIPPGILSMSEQNKMIYINITSQKHFIKEALSNRESICETMWPVLWVCGIRKTVHFGYLLTVNTCEPFTKQMCCRNHLVNNNFYPNFYFSISDTFFIFYCE